jgi:MarR family transcriptional regulator, negative regulator of the multidrug operon emrRAB
VEEFVNNLVGAFSLAVTDAVTQAVTAVAGHEGAMSAAIIYLWQEPDCGIEELRVPLDLSQPAAVRLVNQLVETGLATRSEDAEDRRRVRVRLTAKGRARADELLRARHDAIAGFISRLQARDQRALADLLVKLFAVDPIRRDEAERVCRLCDVDACATRPCPVEAAVSGDT